MNHPPEQTRDTFWRKTRPLELVRLIALAESPPSPARLSARGGV
jgi:hypothetical protein